MKTLIAALLLASTSSFAYEVDATEALLATLPVGTYTGITPNDEACGVTVRNLSEKIAITASANGLTTRNETYVGARYRWNPGQRLFFASILTTTLSGSKENFVRTIAVQEDTQYVVVGDIVRDNNGTKEAVIECIVNL